MGAHEDEFLTLWCCWEWESARVVWRPWLLDAADGRRNSARQSHGQRACAGHASRPSAYLVVWTARPQMSFCIACMACTWRYWVPAWAWGRGTRLAQGTCSSRTRRGPRHPGPSIRVTWWASSQGRCSGSAPTSDRGCCRAGDGRWMSCKIYCAMRVPWHGNLAQGKCCRLN